MGKFNPPDNFDFSHPNEWPQWKQRFERYATITDLSSKDGEIQVSTLVYALGSDAETVFSSFTFTDENEKKDITIVMKKFDDHFVPKRNVIHERAVFHQRSQRQGESVEGYIRALYELAATCEFGAPRDEQIRDRLVVGILDKTISEELQMKSDLTLEKAIQIARQSEIVKSQLTQQQPHTVSEINKGRGSFHRGQRGRRHGHQSLGERTDQRSTPQFTDNGCNRCGKEKHPIEQCPAYRVKCHKCHKTGHYALKCKAPRSTHGHQRGGRGRSVREVVVPDPGSQDESYFLRAIDCDERNDKPWEVKLKICGEPIVFKVDTGADVTVMTSGTYDKLPRAPPLELVTAKINSVGSALPCRGKFNVSIKNRGKIFVMNIYVMETAECNLLSRNASKAMGYIHFKVHETQTVYGDIGLMKGAPVQIRLKDDAVPYSVHAARRISVNGVRPLFQ